MYNIVQMLSMCPAMKAKCKLEKLKKKLFKKYIKWLKENTIVYCSFIVKSLKNKRRRHNRKTYIRFKKKLIIIRN